MPSAIAGFTPTTTTTSTSNSTTGLNSLSSQDFMKLMFTQLEQQDPLNPTDSNQMLSQLSQISTLQSNSQMQTSLQGLTLQQSIGAGGNLMGKHVSGINNSGNITGNVTSVQVQNSQVYLGLDSGGTLPMANVTQISVPTATAGTSTATTATDNNIVQQLLAALTGG